MAGDWIKAEKSTPRKPEILRLASELGIHPDHAYGLCMRWWMWCDDHLTDGHAVGVTLAHLDDMFGHAGFAAVLSKVGWLQVRGSSLEVPNFDRHLSESAKNRALSRSRKAKQRENMSRSERDISVTREEKRREENNSNNLPVRECSKHWSSDHFRKVWLLWLSHVAAVKGPVSEAVEQQWLFRLADYADTAEAIDVVRFSLEKQAKNLILNGDHRKSDGSASSPPAGSRRRSKYPSLDEGVLQ